MNRGSTNKTFFRKKDLSCVLYLLALAVVFGLMQHWAMVKVSFTGELSAFLEKHREERRSLQFQKVKTVSLESTYRLWEENKTLFIDARPAEDYRELHVDRAINFPPEKWDELNTSGLAGLKRDRQILVYCSNKSCDDALILAEKLQTLGFSRVMAFTGGFRAWDEAGYPVDTSL